MEQGIYSVYDSLAEAYMEPWFAKNDATARRSFSVAINEVGHNFNKFPQDFVLFKIGSWDADSGVIDPMVPHSLGVGIEFIISEDGDG